MRLPISLCRSPALNLSIAAENLRLKRVALPS